VQQQGRRTARVAHPVGGRREAILQSLLLELDQHGHEGLELRSVCDRAGISEAEFEAEFADLEEGLFAAYECLSDRLLERVRGSYAKDSAWPEKVRSGLAAVLSAIAENPRLAGVATRGFPAIGPAAYRLYVGLIDRFAALMSEGREAAAVDEQLPTEVELMAVGAAESLIFAEIDAGNAGRLPAMLPDILFSLLVPFLGPERAAEEMQSATPAA
jgi:AcrR family transcriptional regulator